jgi:GAF domain-containing protein
VDPDEWDQLIARFEQSGQPHRVELQWKRRDGSPIWVELRTHVVREPTGRVRYFENFAHEITERHRAEAVLADEKRVLELLASGADPREVLDRLCRLAEGWMPGMLCSVLLLEDGLRLRHGAAPSLPPGYVSAIDGVAIGPEAGSCGTAAHRGEPVVVEDIEQSPLWLKYRDQARAAGVRACWSMPIRDSDGAVLGTFAMYYREPWRPSARDWQLIERASHLAGLAIERARRTAELQRRTADLQGRTAELQASEQL